jgi:ribonuclease PH
MPDQIRNLSLDPSYQSFAEGSAMIKMGLTKVICAASIEERVPQFLRGQGKGWVTAEYSMLPRSTLVRTPREVLIGRSGGRSLEIQRMVGRCLRAVTDLEAVGERSIQVDCDVVQADGGTRTASITGAYVALHQAFAMLNKKRLVAKIPLTSAVAAVSIGLVKGQLLLDLDYAEDQAATVDFNVAMTDNGDIVEFQGAAEGAPFSRQLLHQVIALAEKGMDPLFQAQRVAIESLTQNQ